MNILEIKMRCVEVVAEHISFGHVKNIPEMAQILVDYVVSESIEENEVKNETTE